MISIEIVKAFTGMPNLCEAPRESSPLQRFNNKGLEFDTL